MHKILIVCLIIIGFAQLSNAQSGLDTLSLEEISRKLENPLTDLWSLTFQENFYILTGDFTDQKQWANNFFFQPFLPFPIGEKYMLTFRPVFPLITSPVVINDDTIKKVEHQTGLGDIQLLSLFGPSTNPKVVWGIGATFIFPSATAEATGDGKWAAGPAAMFFYLVKPWTAGILFQHWWSYAGDPDRLNINLTNIQYTIRYTLPKAWSIGMGPTISINWEWEKGSRVTLPIGIGVTKTVRWGKTPFKLRMEPQYSIIKPENVGIEWNIRFQITPVVNRPSKKKA